MMNTPMMNGLRNLFALLLICIAARVHSSEPVKFGNAIYVDLAVGEQVAYLGKTIEVLELENNWSLVRVGDDEAWLDVAKRSLPVTIGGARVFVSDQINVKNLTTDSEVHGLLTKDALLCLSDPSAPLLSPEFTFPISGRDGYRWRMEEDSHMFAYLGLATWKAPDYVRSHEGIDLDMHDARGRERHPLVAIESGTVVLVADSSVTGSRDGCIILKSDTQENIYYVYKHTNPETHRVKEGQKVGAGDMLSYIWGDNVWGHLHFAVVYRSETPGYPDRYRDLLNFFPQFYELYSGSLELAQELRSEGEFRFGHKKETCRNFKRLDVFSELTGYGWKLGDWCVSQKVEGVESDMGGNARLRKTLHAGTRAESENPESSYEFEVAVENGRYLVNATVGDLFLPTSQKLYFENSEAGIFEISEGGAFQRSQDLEVDVADQRLTVRIELLDEDKGAGIRELSFKRMSQRPTRSTPAPVR